MSAAAAPAEKSRIAAVERTRLGGQVVPAFIMRSFPLTIERLVSCPARAFILPARSAAVNTFHIQ